MSVNPKVSLAKLVLTHDESIDTPLSIANQNGTFYYHRDHQGSIVALTDSSGQVVESFTYDNHYGTIINHTKITETNNPYAYTGRELDTSELYYYRAWYYDATMQRFISGDPIGFDSGDFNFYRYVFGNPVNLVDPSGLEGYSDGDWFPCINGEESNKDILDKEKNWCDALENGRTPPKCKSKIPTTVVPWNSKIKVETLDNGRIKVTFDF